MSNIYINPLKLYILILDKITFLLNNEFKNYNDPTNKKIVRINKKIK